MKSLKLPIIFILALITGGCQALTVNEVEKKIKPAGQPGQFIVVQYSAIIQVNEAITISSIKLEGASKVLSVVIYSMPEGQIIAPENNLVPGKYFVKATAPYKNEQAKSEDELLFSIITSTNKNVIVKKKSVLKKRT